MERVPKGRETREERLFFPVGTDRPARRRPAALDRDHPPASPVPGIGPAGLESCVSACVQFEHSARGISTASVPARQPISAAICGVCVPADYPAHCGAQRVRAHAGLHHRDHPPGYTGGGVAHPAAADAAATGSSRTEARPVPRLGPRAPAFRVHPGCALSLQPHSQPRLADWLCRPCRAHFSLCGCCGCSMATGAGPAVFPDTRWA